MRIRSINFHIDINKPIPLIAILFFTSLLFSCHSHSPKVPEKKPVHVITSCFVPDRTDTIGPFKYQISRSYHNQYELDLIKKAESLLPTKDTIISLLKSERDDRLETWVDALNWFNTDSAHRDRCVGKWIRRNKLSKDSVIKIISSINKEYDESKDTNSLWWYSGGNDLKIPYAITGCAVQYYLKVIIDYRKGIFLQGYPIKDASFTYNVSVQYHDKYTYRCCNIWDPDPVTMRLDKFILKISVDYSSVFVVTMKIRWSHYCGMKCALSFEKERVVIFDSKGNLMKIYNDGKVTNMFES